MEQYFGVAGIIALILLAVKYLLGRARTDDILAELGKVNDQKKKEAYEKELARLTKEIEDAELDYKRIRDGRTSQPADTSSDV